MTRLAEILDQMSAVLNDLKTVMDQEQQHLSMGQINGSQLQWITEQKSSLLATLDYLEQLRRKEPNAANSVDISQRWQEITVKTQQLRQMNQHNGWLLEGQIERNQQALEMLKPHQEPTLYGANGQTSTTHRGGKRLRSEDYLRPALQAGMHCYTVRRANSLTLKPSTASAAKYAAIPASTTAIKRSKRRGMVPNDHSGMICNIPKSTPDITSTATTRRNRNAIQPGCGVKIFCLRNCQ